MAELNAVPWPIAKRLVSGENPHEIWRQAETETEWHVLKKFNPSDYGADSRWFCKIVSPEHPEGDTMSVCVSEIKAKAKRIK